ncbi:MAG: hypothetical protein PF487_00255, partial [Bacteroidales bacterium]|nr:hypothetical protein [Bacteroidales bacterium]
FDAFLIIKFLNFSHQKYYKKKPIVEMCYVLINSIDYKRDTSELKMLNEAELLKLYRELDD